MSGPLVTWRETMSVACPGGSMDLLARVGLVEVELLKIDDVSHVWAGSPSCVSCQTGPFWPLGLLVLGLGI